MAQIVKLVDDLDGSDADETVRFALDSGHYEIDLTKKNAAALRKLLAPYIEMGRPDVAVPAPKKPRQISARNTIASAASSGGSLFSALSKDEKLRFRKWANKPTTRRIADSAVRDWTSAGLP